MHFGTSLRARIWLEIGVCLQHRNLTPVYVTESTEISTAVVLSALAFTAGLHGDRAQYLCLRARRYGKPCDLGRRSWAPKPGRRSRRWRRTRAKATGRRGCLRVTRPTTRTVDGERCGCTTEVAVAGTWTTTGPTLTKKWSAGCPRCPTNSGKRASTMAGSRTAAVSGHNDERSSRKSSCGSAGTTRSSRGARAASRSRTLGRDVVIDPILERHDL